eukprot:11267426-Karenia_brevis.AAC.1
MGSSFYANLASHVHASLTRTLVTTVGSTPSSCQHWITKRDVSKFQSSTLLAAAAWAFCKLR